MQIACYKGKSLVSRIIRFITRSKYSHAAFVFDVQASAVAQMLRERYSLARVLTEVNPGAVVEAWSNGVRNVRSISAQHTPGTPVDVFEFWSPLTSKEEENLVLWLAAQIGRAYAFLDVLRFVTRRKGNSKDGRWFCSELVSAGCYMANRELLARTEWWEVPPDWVPRSTVLRLAERTITRGFFPS